MPAPADNRSNQYAKVARDVVEVPPPDAGHIIRVFRLRVGLTLEGLAQALGISFSTVSRWENGHMKPSRLAWQALGKLAAENGRPLLVESSEHARKRRIVSERLTTRGSA